MEEARISMRGIRDKVWEEIQNKEKNGEIGEDDKFRLKKEMQKIVDNANDNIDKLYDNKENEINQ